MAGVDMKFTKKRLDDLMPDPEKTLFFFTDEPMGLGLSVFPTGAKSFIFQGRVAGTNKKRRITLGRYGTITLKTAEDLAVSWADRLAKGEDPVVVKQKRMARAVTLEDAKNAYFEKGKSRLKPGTIRDMKKAMKDLDDWMNKPITEITRRMVEKRHREIGDRSPSLANQVFRYLRAILNFASRDNATDEGVELLPSNPVNSLSHNRLWYRVNRRTGHLKKHQIKPWLKAVVALPDVPEREPGSGKEFPQLKQGEQARDFYLMLLLTGLRRSEVLGLSWDRIDFDARTLTIPGSKTKNWEPHVLPLPDYLFEILQRRYESKTTNNILDGFTNFRYAEKRVETTTGIKLTPHDLRRSFATAAESLNISSYAVKTLLNHKQSDVTAGYIQFDVERLRGPMQQIEDYFLMTAGIVKPRVVKPVDQERVENE
jgi:integrase